MDSKIITFKYPKKPATLVNNAEVLNYIFYLENKNELDKLPFPILMYYVLGLCFTNEINDGGFVQYLSNSSVKTLPYLFECAEALECEPLTSIINDLLMGISNHLGTDDVCKIKEAEFSSEFDSLLSQLDCRFYELDEELDVLRLINEYYTENLPSGLFEVELFKEPSGENVRYFVSSCDNPTEIQAAGAFMDFVSEFSNTNFEIEISIWDSIFRLTATDYSNSLNLEEIMEFFPSKDYSFGDSKATDRDMMLCPNLDGNLNGLYIAARNEKRDAWRVAIEKSGFDENEYKMKYSLCSKYTPALHDGVNDTATITLGDMVYDESKVELIKDILVQKATVQRNISKVYEKNISFGTSKLDVKENILFEV